MLNLGMIKASKPPANRNAVKVIKADWSPIRSAKAPKPSAAKPPIPTDNPNMNPETAPTLCGAASEAITTITDQLA